MSAVASPISPRALMAGYVSQGSDWSTATRAGTASAEPICPRLAAAACLTLRSGSERARMRAGTADGARTASEHHGGEIADLLVRVGQEPPKRSHRSSRRDG